MILECRLQSGACSSSNSSVTGQDEVSQPNGFFNVSDRRDSYPDCEFILEEFEGKASGRRLFSVGSQVVRIGKFKARHENKFTWNRPRGAFVHRQRLRQADYFLRRHEWE